MNLVHLHKRKRGPTSSFKIKLLDKIVYAAGLISLGMMIPQLHLIYTTKSASGLEPITWLTLSLMDVPWVIYGFVHKEKPLIFIYTSWFIINGLIFVGAVLY